MLRRISLCSTETSWSTGMPRGLRNRVHGSWEWCGGPTTGHAGGAGRRPGGGVAVCSRSYEDMAAPSIDGWTRPEPEGAPLPSSSHIGGGSAPAAQHAPRETLGWAHCAVPRIEALTATARPAGIKAGAVPQGILERDQQVSCWSRSRIGEWD